MAKTALEITPEERLAYRPCAAIQQREGIKSRKEVEERWQRAQLLARQAAKRLREQFAVSRVILFGSAVRQPWFTPWSDVDLAVWGLPPERFYAAVASVTGLSDEIRIDLVDPEQCSRVLRMTIERDGMEL